MFPHNPEASGKRSVSASPWYPVCNMVSLLQNNFLSSRNGHSHLLPAELEREVQTPQAGMQSHS